MFDKHIRQIVESLLREKDKKLSIIHVLDNIPMPDTTYGTMIPLDKDSGHGLLEAEKARLMQIGDRLSVAQANRWMVWGAPKQEIVQIAEQEQVDLIRCRFTWTAWAGVVIGLNSK